MGSHHTQRIEAEYGKAALEKKIRKYQVPHWKSAPDKFWRPDKVHLYLGNWPKKGKTLLKLAALEEKIVELCTWG